ncbi:hypothetical protein SY2F82_20700 [Streptomyces sp. Y2F8-2]|nr:hypothetical protein SY2F82_20700 [Streptomyces sp. Y2F8-2]
MSDSPCSIHARNRLGRACSVAAIGVLLPYGSTNGPATYGTSTPYVAIEDAALPA